MKLNCLNFYVELCSQIKSRFNFDDPILKIVKILNPHVVGTSNTVESIVDFQIYFPYLVDDIESLDDEWRVLQTLEEIVIYKENSVPEFWSQVSEVRNAVNELMFPHLKKLISALLSLPHSSATAERIFSQLNLIKTKLRNRLNVETCSSLIFTKQLLGEFKCYEFEPCDSLLNCNINNDSDPSIQEDLTF